MNCYVCSENSWEKVTIEKDGKQVPIHTEMTLQVCLNCGNACHSVEPISEDKIKEYYRKEYRGAPNINNLLTTTHKQNYIAVFLREFLTGKKGLVCGDVGCATGYLPAFLRQLGHKATGCEYTITYRRFAEHYYGIPITEELEPKHKYDFISMYHVLEHIVEPDKKLAHYVSMLKDDGHMLISTPEWFGVLEEASGTPLVSFDNLFHKNHINLFSRRSLQNLFANAGLEIVKEDFLVYGQTYLVRKASGGTLPAVVFENPQEQIKSLQTQYKAIGLFLANQLKEVVALYPNTPEAWLKQIFVLAMKDLDKQTDLFAAATEACPGSYRIKAGKATWLYQQGKLQEALAVYQDICAKKPNENDFMFMGYCLAQLGDHATAKQCFLTACQIDPRKWTEAQNWACAEACKMPTWDEKAVAQVKETLFQQNKDNVKIKPRDPVMDAASA